MCRTLWNSAWIPWCRNQVLVEPRSGHSSGMSTMRWKRSLLVRHCIMAGSGKHMGVCFGASGRSSSREMCLRVLLCCGHSTLVCSAMEPDSASKLKWSMRHNFLPLGSWKWDSSTGANAPLVCSGVLCGAGSTESSVATSLELQNWSGLRGCEKGKRAGCTKWEVSCTCERLPLSEFPRSVLLVLKSSSSASSVKWSCGCSGSGVPEGVSRSPISVTGVSLSGVYSLSPCSRPGPGESSPGKGNSEVELSPRRLRLGRKSTEMKNPCGKKWPSSPGKTSFPFKGFQPQSGHQESQAVAEIHGSGAALGLQGLQHGLLSDVWPDPSKSQPSHLLSRWWIDRIGGHRQWPHDHSCDPSPRAAPTHHWPAQRSKLDPPKLARHEEPHHVFCPHAVRDLLQEDELGWILAPPGARM